MDESEKCAAMWGPHWHTDIAQTPLKELVVTGGDNRLSWHLYAWWRTLSTKFIE